MSENSKKIGFVSGQYLSLLGIEVIAKRNELPVKTFDSRSTSLDEITQAIINSQMILVIIDLELLLGNGRESDGIAYATELQKSGVRTVIRASEKHQGTVTEAGLEILDTRSDGISLMATALLAS
jgi:hypothetical protein